MARLFTTGAEEQDIQALWDSVGWTLNYPNQLHPTGYTDFLSTDPRTGKGVYALLASNYLHKDFGSTTTYTELYFGFAVKFATLNANPFFYVYTDDPTTYAAYLSLRIEATGAVNATRTGTNIAGTDAGTITINQWYYFEVYVKPANSGGRFVVKIDGNTLIDYTGDTTTDKEYCNGYRFLGVENTSAKVGTLFDDIVVNDTSGSVNNTYPGQVRLLPIRPYAAGQYADFSRAGVDLGNDMAQTHNGTFAFTMLQTADADDKVTFLSDVPDLPVGATIANVVISERARVESGSGVIAPMVRANTTDSISADQTLTSTWKYYQYAWKVNPADSAAWEESDLSTLQIGTST